MPMAALPSHAIAVTLAVVDDTGQEITVEDADAPPLGQFYAHAVPRAGETLCFYAGTKMDQWDVVSVYWMIPTGLEIAHPDGSSTRPVLVHSPIVQVRRRRREV